MQQGLECKVLSNLNTMKKTKEETEKLSVDFMGWGILHSNRV